MGPNFPEEEKLVLDKFRSAEAMAAFFPGGRELVWVLGMAFKFLRSPARRDVEGQPLPEAGNGLGLGVVGEDARVNNGIIRAGEHVVGPFAHRGGHSANVGNGTLVIA